MVNRYDAGKTIMIPVPCDLLWSLMGEFLHKRQPAEEGTTGTVVAPPRRRPESISTLVQGFINSNPGQFCTREIMQQHGNVNPYSLRNAIYALSRRGKINQSEGGKWYPQA